VNLEDCLYLQIIHMWMKSQLGYALLTIYTREVKKWIHKISEGGINYRWASIWKGHAWLSPRQDLGCY
jgi:hypothetical protein